jgi:hypothetical protein
MSLINSILGPLSPRLRNPSEDHHELPLYDTSPRSPQASPAFPPRPVASSMYASPVRFDQKARVPDDLLAVQRKARHLEEELQDLLDAQAEGLMAGLGNGQLDDHTSTGSSTPTVSSMRRNATNPPRQPSRRKYNLRAARRGIYRRIQQLAAVKEEESYLLESDLSKNKVVLERITKWEAKRNGLGQRIQAIEKNGTRSKAHTLKEEASKLEAEIRQLEEKLWGMKAKHRRILEELSETENAVEAKLSSYKASLSLLESEVTKFLARPPPESHRNPSKTSTFFSLPPKRRTLAMAKDYWQDEQTRLEENYQEVDIDRDALEEGAVLWNDVINNVTDFESGLQEEMQRMGRSRDPNDMSPASPDNSIKGLISRMDRTMLYIESKLKLAESKNWKLLVCCIGAELEAFKQGREILENALSVMPDSRSDAEQHSDTSENEPATHSSLDHEPNSSPESSRQPYSNQKFFDTDDDDPDPELLISHQDTDTE